MLNHWRFIKPIMKTPAAVAVKLHLISVGKLLLLFVPHGVSA
jgi:hypothetical protein